MSIATPYCGIVGQPISRRAHRHIFGGACDGVSVTLAEVLAIAIPFSVGALVTSKVFYALKVRDRPW
jgi:hypothetical protein